MFEFLFSYPLSVYDEARWIFDSSWPLWLIVALSLSLTLIVACSLYKSRTSLKPLPLIAVGTLQLCMFALLILMLLKPSLLIERLVANENHIAVMLDTSQSMAYGDSGKTRIGTALAALSSQPLDQVSQTYATSFFTFSDGAQSVSSYEALPLPGQSTKLGDSLIQVLQRASTSSLAAIVLASDGVEAGDGAIGEGLITAEQLAQIIDYGVPIHSIGIGREQLPEDLELTRLSMPTRVLPNTRVSAEVSVRHDAPGTARVKVYNGDEFLGSRDIILGAEPGVTHSKIEFDIGNSGFKQLEFRVDPTESERNLDNNSLSRLVEVAAQKYRILYVEGEPRWEYKFIRRAFEEDSTLELNTLLWVSENKFYRQGIESADQLAEGFPISRDQLYGYDALIIGSIAAPNFSADQQQMIHDFVSERGGSLLMLGGRQGLSEGSWGNTPVADALPSRLKDIEIGFARQPASAQLSAAGMDATLLRFSELDEVNSELWQSLPELADYHKIGSLRPAATTLLRVNPVATAASPTPLPSMPLLVSQPYGLGSSYILATSGTWRWQMHLESDDSRHHTFWRQLARSMVIKAANQFELSTEQRGNSRVVRAEIRDSDFNAIDDVRVTALVSPAGFNGDNTGISRTLDLRALAGEPGVYEAEFIADDSTASSAIEGGGGADTRVASWFVDAIVSRDGEPIESARLAFDAPTNKSELFNLRQNRAQLERLAEMTGGQYWQADDLAELPLAIARSEAGVLAQSIYPLWNLPALFLLLILVKAGEWLLRRRCGRI